VSRRKRPRRFKTTFENGGFWEYYLDLERGFEDILEYVPYIDKNESACSYRLVNLLLSIGGHVDSAFKEMTFYRRFSKIASCMEIRRKVKETRKRIRANQSPILVRIEECLKTFEPIYRLSTGKVIFKRLPERDCVVPFCPNNPKTGAPRWWDIYNGLKHDFSDYFEQASLRTTRDALAGAFLLNVVHYPAILRLYEYGLLDFPPHPIETSLPSHPWQYASFSVPPETLEDMLRRGQPLSSFNTYVETALFVHEYR
jgi:hypothetical protein